MGRGLGRGRNCRIVPVIVRERSRALRGATGPVAQWLEPTAHNGLVAGSSPAGPTNIFN